MTAHSLEILTELYCFFDQNDFLYTSLVQTADARILQLRRDLAVITCHEAAANRDGVSLDCTICFVLLFTDTRRIDVLKTSLQQGLYSYFTAI